jgi:hypothetical protein
MPQTFARTEVGVREDLADLISNIDAKTTPLLSSVPRGPELVNVNFDWQADAYDPPDTDGIVDGLDASATEDASANRARLYGRCQRLWKTPKVSNFTDIQDVAGLGKGKEFARAIMKKTIELKRSVESVLGSDNVSQDDNGTVPYKTRGLGEWIKATAQSHLPVASAFLTPANSINTTATGSLAISDINTVLQSQYNQTGAVNTYTLLVGQTLKAQLTELVSYQGTRGGNSSILKTEISTANAWEHNIQSFTGDFGTYDIVLSNWLGWNNTTKAPNLFRGYALDMDMLELRMNTPWKFTELPNMGGGRRGIVEVICGLMVKNPLGLAKFAASS